MTLKTQLDDVRPGEFALVRCVKTRRYREGDREVKIFDQVPVFPGPPHSDEKFIGLKLLHYHFDFRFANWYLIQHLLPGDVLLDPEEWPSMVLLASEVIGEPFYLHLKCEREAPIMGDWYDFLKCLENGYLGQSLLPGHICPHQGYKVIENPHIEQRFSKALQCRFACPGHGLRFGDDEKVVRATQASQYSTREIEDSER